MPVRFFMHPARPATRADYVNEPQSKYEIWQVLGWPFETSVAMARMVFSGLFDKLPQMRIITHHCGAMMPFFAGWAETLWAQLGSRSADEQYDELLKTMKNTPIEYFRMFYADTVLGGSASALRCGLDFSAPTGSSSRATAPSTRKAARCSSAKAPLGRGSAAIR
jgi:uncharacterized protein